jgi:hypothetical protein
MNFKLKQSAMHLDYYSMLSTKIVKKTWILVFLVLLSYTFPLSNLSAQTLLDNYDGTGGLVYTADDVTYWVVNSNVFEGQTGGATTPEHSYASYDLTNSFSSYTLGKANSHSWFGWIDLNRTSVSGWGGNSYSAGMVLAANAADFNDTNTKGYAVVFDNSNDKLVLIRFDAGITDGTADLPGTSTVLATSSYTYADSDNGVNFYVSYNSGGTWTIYTIAGAQLTDANTTNSGNYNDPSVTSAADETYSGQAFKYTGWVYAHNNGASETAYFDNLGAGFNDASPPETTYNPYDTEEGAPIDGTITITFNEAIRNINDLAISDAEAEAFIDIQETDASGAVIDFSATIDGSKKVITITPDAVLTNNQLYYVSFTATSVEDGADHAMTADENITFTAIPFPPTNHPTDFIVPVASPPTYKDIKLTWDANNSTESATGFLILVSTGTQQNVEDGVPIDDQTNLVTSNDGAINVINGGTDSETYTFDNLHDNRDYNFKIIAYTGSGDNINYKNDGSEPTTTGKTDTAPDSDSFVAEPDTQVPENTSFSSMAVNETDTIPVFRFKITDKGTNDGLVTEVTNIRVRPNTTNTADWTETIQGIGLHKGAGADITTGTPTITDTYMDIPVTSELSVTGGSSETVSLSIYLNNDSIVDGQVLSFYIDGSAPGFEADEYGGSTFDDALPGNTDIASNDFTITVEATELQFQYVPTLVNVGVEFDVEVAATDANGNIDLDNTASVTLDTGTTGGGDITSADGVTASLSSGTHSWDDVKYDTKETFDLKASGGGLTLVESSIEAYAATAATPGSVIISEFIPNPDAVSDANGEYIELFNSNSFSVDINGWKIYNASTLDLTIGSSVSISAGGFIVLGNSTNTGVNGNYTADYAYGSSVVLEETGSDAIIITNETDTEIDKVQYDDTDWTIPSGSSLVYTGTINDDNNIPANWIASEKRENGFLDASITGDFGSPGTNGYKQNLVDSTTWIGTGNWSEGNLGGTKATATDYWYNGYPGSVTDVYVKNELTVDIDNLALCNNLTIIATDSLIISPGSALTVNGNLEVVDDVDDVDGGFLSLQADGTDGVSSLITYGTVTGNANVQSYFADTDKWYLVSSPISDGKGAIFTDDYFYSWYEPTYDWVNQIVLTYPLAPGTGYTINKQGSSTVNYPGVLNTGTVSNTTLSHTASTPNPDSNDGWNLLGNPYPSVIDASLFDFTNIAGGIYVYLHNDVRDTYVFWSKTLGTVGSTGGDGDSRARFIQPGQGFWANSNDDAHGETFSYTNAMRTHFNHGEFSKSSDTQSAEKNYVLKIMVSGNGLTDPTYIAFREESSLDYDKEYDLRKMLSRHPEVPHIFSLAGTEKTEKLAVNAIESPLNETVIPLGLKIGTDGDYRLYFERMNSFDEDQNFYLRDLLDGEMYDIQLQPMLEFTHSTTNPEYRFDLVMGLQTDINNPLGISPQVEVYSSRNSLYIRSGEKQEIVQVEVKNLLGQTVYSSQYSDSFKTGISLNLPTAFYVVQVQLKTGDYSKKIFIQNLN